ncbi:replicative DNA helicase [Pirellulaceae bacterium SH467]
MVLSTALLDPQVLLEHLTGLESRDIANVALRQLFELVSKMQRNKEPITLHSVLLACSRSGLIQDLGGPVGFNELLDSAPSIAHATYYRKELQRLAETERTFQSVYDSVIRLSHKDCDIDRELQYLRKIHDGHASTEDSLAHCNDVLQQLTEKATSSRCKVTFGIPSLDGLVTGGLDCKWLVLIGGRFGKGKSTLACQLFSHAVQEGRCVAMFSLEMTRHEVLERVCSNEIGIPMTAWRKQNRPPEVSIAIEKMRRQSSNCKWWIDDRASQTIDSIRSKCELLKLRDGLDLVIIDNLQLIQSRLDARQPRDLHYTTISRSLKVMAKELDCVVVLLCQLDTEAAKQRPTSANWASAKAIEADADVALMIHESNEQYEIIGTKIRNGIGGRFVPVKFDGLYQRFESAGLQNEFSSDFL